VDNSDNILYSFPGKEVIPLEVGATEMQAFKTFLKPGDKINITAIFTDNGNSSGTGDMWSTGTTENATVRPETVFSGLMVADLLNSKGDSILDIYSGYDQMSVWEQAQLDSSESFKESTEPKTLLVAFTPEEKVRYYNYLSKDDIEFKISLPQRDN